MAFFPPEKLNPSKISIDSQQISAASPEIELRLARIAENYDRLNGVLAELESRMDSDQNLQALDDEALDFEATFGFRRKRRRRPTDKSRAKQQKLPTKVTRRKPR